MRSALSGANRPLLCENTDDCEHGALTGAPCVECVQVVRKHSFGKLATARTCPHEQDMTQDSRLAYNRLHVGQRCLDNPCSSSSLFHGDGCYGLFPPPEVTPVVVRHLSSTLPNAQKRLPPPNSRNLVSSLPPTKWVCHHTTKPQPWRCFVGIW